MNQLQDKFARQFHYLRLSITDNCNFRCVYCLPNGMDTQKVTNLHTEDLNRTRLKPKSFLSLSEIGYLVETFAKCGVEKVRITGGEPSLRKDLNEIISRINDVPNIKKIALTTNGYRLTKEVSHWRLSGLTQLNVSVDSLDPVVFHQITGTSWLKKILEGIDRAFEVGFKQVKVNAVLLKSMNDHQFEQYLNWIKTRPIQLRFIELMQTGEMDTFFAQHHCSGQRLKERLLKEGWFLKLKEKDDGPATVFTHPDYIGEIGLIMPYETNFCDGCNRLRVSSLGKLHLCLFGEYGVDLRDLLNHEDQSQQLIERIQFHLKDKVKGHFLHEGLTGATPHLASIGG